MISSKYKCIFIHIPKTGGDSIEKTLWSSHSNEELFGLPNFYQTGGLQHLMAKQIQKKIRKNKYNSYFKFAFVRNPWSKAVSQYKYTIYRRPDLQRILNINNKSTFEEYLHALKRVKFIDSIITNVCKRIPKLKYIESRFNSRLHIQWEKQYKFVVDNEMKLIVDFLGRFENLQNDFNKICKIINVNQCILPHNKHGVYNNNKEFMNKHYKEFYNDYTKNLLYSIYKDDVDFFKYDF